VPALAALLRQLGEWLDRLSDEQYARKPVGVVPSSVGGHVRHSLDHFEALLAALETGRLDYDDRRRGTDVERCRATALSALRGLERRLLAARWPEPNRPLRLRALLSAGSPPVEAHSSVGRELAFVLSHTVHHNSLLATIAALLGVPAPERFGYAPSTIAYQEGSSCVR
jgi:hypothetical protein